VHFYAADCINCIRNYPWYREWHQRFKDKPVALIGIHTPETEAERDASAVRKKAADAKLEFPILIDGRNENWNAWGNSMWPSVYVIDKRGYLRFFWPGELKWQGNDGEKYMRERIEQLLLEPAA
jgi:peroxiredoxin